ncbi:WD40 repeat-like protein [Tothia fuscella]|uniref:WD40 repeat-like protein n=1 Tax=Tothia fuscella TaxID=1048955 RepID=A0A9P4NKW5_9PEZI|nr:WD40 repeat-like protein [Tothia fuscella]
MPITMEPKVRKPPPITPKRFNKFFTPKQSKSSNASKSGRALRDLTQSGLNRRAGQQPPTKRRKLYLTPDSSPPRSSPCKNPLSSEDIAGIALPSSPPAFLEDEMAPPSVRRARTSGICGRMLQRTFGVSDAIGRGRRKDNGTNWQTHTNSFYSRPEDVHTFAYSAVPFSTASCNTNTLIATGDESGSIRLIESAEDAKHGFSSTYLTFQPHTNAVMDMAFSPDDSLLATASGDQTSKVIDMRTQKTKFLMHEHTTSVKQVRFQPDNDNIIATSSRDGSVQIWDMRCRAEEVVVSETARPLGFAPANELNLTYKAFGASTYNNSIHTPNPRIGAISVTAISFLSSPGRSHLLLTGSEASTTLKLWDIRNRYSRRGPPTPLSTTQQPESHSRHRHFGISTIVLNTDESRIYALSRDNTVYAYSTSHLILGHAPELSSGFAAKNPRSIDDGRTGLGPIYGFRHPQFHATSFYVKAAIRKAKNDKPELLAVGSSEGCPILFPTDETFLSRQRPEQPSFVDADSPSDDEENDPPSSSPPNPSPAMPHHKFRRPIIHRAASSASLSTRMRDTIPIYDNIGTPLLPGHGKEVTGLCWSWDGQLITIGDDYSSRCWREGPKAREMRRKEFTHERHGWGLAKVDEGWDSDDG